MNLSYDFAVQPLIEQGKVQKSDIEEVKNWVEAEGDIPALTEEQIVLFLLSCDNDQSSTRTTIKAHYDYKRRLPELFDDKSADLDEDVKFMLTRGYYVIFPVRTPDGSVIVYNGIRKSVPGRYTVPSMRVWIMLFEAICKEGPPNGLIILSDMKNINYLHLPTIKVGYLRTTFRYAYEGVPIKLKKIYTLNVSYLIGVINSLMRPLLPKATDDMMTLVSAGKEEEVLTKDIPRECLPSDFGGTLACIESLQQSTIEKLRALQPFFDAEQKQRHEFYANKKNKD